MYRRACLLRFPSVIVRPEEAHARIPFRLVLREHLALRVVANVTDVGVAADVKLCGTELGHDDECGTAMGSVLTIWGRSRVSIQKFARQASRLPHDVNQSATPSSSGVRLSHRPPTERVHVVLRGAVCYDHLYGRAFEVQ
jgi:hypothetical protein